MPAQEYVNPRFTITVKKEILPIIERYAEINGVTRAASVSKLLEELAPMMQLAINAHEEAEKNREKALNSLYEGFMHHVADGIQKNIPMSFKDKS